MRRKVEEPIKRDGILRLVNFNFPGVIGADDSVLDKLMVAEEEGKIIDGHGPNPGNRHRTLTRQQEF